MKQFLILLAFGLLIYTRFVNLSWGLPYPLHPDERNMAVAIQQFSCDQNPDISIFYKLPNCLNPHFFAYGQFPLYVSYAMIQGWHSFKGVFTPTTFYEAVMALRIISAIFSILTVFLALKIVVDIYNYLIPRTNESMFFFSFITALVFIFSPVLIQFAHFGTTESLLIFFYILLLYISLKVLYKRDFLQTYLLLSGIVCGMAIATKVSAIVYCTVPLYCLLHDSKSIDNFFTKILYRIVALARFTTIVMIFGLIFSPYSIIELKDFYGSFEYESSVALGSLNVFYTRQFFYTTPFLFQFKSIFPYTIGWGMLILFLLGFIFLPWKNRFINLLRISFLLIFVPNAYVYAKWTRFIAPAYAIMLIISVTYLFYCLQSLRIFFKRLKSYQSDPSDTNVLYSTIFLICVISILPGIAFLSIYQNTDVRFVASEWIYKNIPSNSYILAETANVIDIPIPSPQQIYSRNTSSLNSYNYKSFNYYDLDTEPTIQTDLVNEMAKADYIFVPSRRIFSNHTCYEIQNTKIGFQKNIDDRCLYRLRTYPLLNRFYKDLFNGDSGFVQVAEFSSYPKIQFFGTTLIEFPDENAEETWTVFDHPVIRIYKKVSLHN